MKIIKKHVLPLFAFLVLINQAVISQENDIIDTAGMQETMDGAVKAFAQALPFYSTLGLNWADAYIGQIVDTPPHFGIGTVFGVSTLKKSALGPMEEKNLGSMANDIKALTKFIPIPQGALEGRIGGFGIPFDIGLKLAWLPRIITKNAPLGFTVNTFTFGTDFRYAILKEDIKRPAISAGIGVTYVSGEITRRVIKNMKYEYYAAGSSTPQYFEFSTPTLGLGWKSTTLDLKTQISKNFSFITPYLGFGASYSWTKANYYSRSDSSNLSASDIDKVNNYLESKGLSRMDISQKKLERTLKNQRFSVRTFGGFSLNMAAIKIDFTGLYDFREMNFGGTVGFRFQM